MATKPAASPRTAHGHPIQDAADPTPGAAGSAQVMYAIHRVTKYPRCVRRVRPHRSAGPSPDLSCLGVECRGVGGVGFRSGDHTPGRRATPRDAEGRARHYYNARRGGVGPSRRSGPPAVAAVRRAARAPSSQGASAGREHRAAVRGHVAVLAGEGVRGSRARGDAAAGHTMTASTSLNWRTSGAGRRGGRARTRRPVRVAAARPAPASHQLRSRSTLPPSSPSATFRLMGEIGRPRFGGPGRKGSGRTTNAPRQRARCV